MSSYRISREAADDLRDINAFTLDRWGEVQAKRYLFGLEALFREIGKSPQRGRPVVGEGRQLRQMRYQRHIVFYGTEESGVLILRILHGAMDFTRHL